MQQKAISQVLAALKQHQPAKLIFDTGQEKYTRIFAPPQRLILLGGGHISQALCRLTKDLDFSVWVVDDRPEFANSRLFPDAEQIICDSFESAIEKIKPGPYDLVAVLTRGHRWDADCLRAISKGEIPSYLGLIGSKRRVRGLLAILAEEGMENELLDRITSPIGLDIKAISPAEIAVSILAQIILHCRTQKPKAGVLPLQNTDYDLLLDLEQTPERVLAVVVETKGSVPAEAGSLMTVGVLGRINGTVGGGCGESDVINKARQTLKTKAGSLVFLDMTAEVAESEGMVCGGWMKVWLEPFCQ